MVRSLGYVWRGLPSWSTDPSRVRPSEGATGNIGVLLPSVALSL